MSIFLPYHDMTVIKTFWNVGNIPNKLVEIGNYGVKYC